MRRAILALVLLCMMHTPVAAQQLLFPGPQVFPPGVGWANARQFGVTCNGVTDDSVALQSAINNGAVQTLYIPAQTCNFGTTLQLKRGLSLVGAGRASILNYTGAGIAIQALETPLPGFQWGLVIRDLQVQSTTGTVGIELNQLAEAELNNVRVFGGAGATGFSTACVRLTGTNPNPLVRIFIHNSFLTQCAGHGILGTGTNNINQVFIQGSVINGNQLSGIRFDNDGKSVLIAGNDIEGNVQQQILFNASGPVQIIGNYFEQTNATEAVNLAASRPLNSAMLFGNEVAQDVAATNSFNIGAAAVANNVIAIGNDFSGSQTNTINWNTGAGGIIGPNREASGAALISGSVTGAITFNAAGENNSTAFILKGVKNFIAGTPSISSGFGTGPSVTGGNTTSFRVNVGTGGVATSGVIAMNATATNGWNCFVEDQTTANINTRQSASTTTTVTFATTVAWTASDILIATCAAF